MKKQEEAIPTSIFDTEADQEMQAQYGMGESQKPAFLYVERGPGMGQLLEVKQGSVVIGRASVADLRIQHPSVSRRHCQIRRVGEQFFVKDLGSQNGTFVNKTRIGTETETKPGDTIALGNALVRLRGPLAKGEKLPHQQAQAPESEPALPPVKEKAQTRSQAPLRPSPKKIEVEERNKRVSTAVVARPSGIGGEKNSNLLKIAIFLGALVIGLMVMLVIALVMSFRSQQPVIVKEVPSGPPALSAPLPASERDRIIQEALAKKMAEVKELKEAKAAAQAAEGAAEQPSVEASAPVVVRREAPIGAPPTVRAAPTPSAAKVAMAKTARPARAAAAPAAAASDDEGDDGASSKGGAKRAQLLASYEKGNAEGSLDAAKKAGDKDLVQKLTAFLTAYDAANEAMMGNNGTQAIVNFQKALALDEQLSNGWGKYGAEIRKHLANLYTLVGMQYASVGQADNAKKAFQAALKHDPSNARAKAQLEKLGSGDEGGDEAPAPKAKPAPKKTAKSSIDDAFGD